MPRLEQEEQSIDSSDEVNDLALVVGETSLSVPQLEYEESFETPPRIDEK